MTAPAREGIGRLLPADYRFELIDQIQAGQGVLDLLAASFDVDALAARNNAGFGAVTLPLRVRTLDAIPPNRWVSVERLARAVASKPKPLIRSTLAPLAELELIEVDGPRIRLTGRWQPLAVRLVGIELKLSKWKDAVRQADNAAWACDRTWVVLDAARARAACDHREYFRCFGVGLALLDDQGVLRIIEKPRRRRQVRWLRALVGELAWQRVQTV